MSLVRAALAVAALSSLVLVPAADARDVTFGPRASVSDEADFGVGADVRWTFLGDDPRLALTASFDYFFPEEEFDDDIEGAVDEFEDLFGDLEIPIDFGELLDTDVEYWEANLNLTWDFTTGGAVIPYAGVGVNYGRLTATAFGIETDDGEVGANVLAGVRIRDRFYVEAKQEAGGGELFVLSVGVRF